MRTPIVLAQIFGLLAALGGIFADGQVTQLRLALAGITVLALGTSAIVIYTEGQESGRLRRYIETILSAVEVPYFIIESISNSMNAIARKNGFTATQQENLRIGTYYTFVRPNGDLEGYIFLSEAEFKRIWLLDEKRRKKYIEHRLMDDEEIENDDAFNPTGRSLKEEFLVEFARAVSVRMAPQADAFSLSRDKDGRDLTLRVSFGDRDFDIMQLPEPHRKDLLSTKPLKRYSEVEQEIRVSIQQITSEGGVPT